MSPRLFLCFEKYNPAFNNKSSMLYKLGRLLQFAGLVVLPVAMSGELTHQLDVRQMLTLCGAGIIVFFLGWLLQQGAKPR
ncbi:MAG TPA: hypothetical protein VGZ25_03235 [Gemmataceae bacterium]|nr:hypothetical protein [Gemmataceae bacterium]